MGVPNTFSNGTIANATEVNANFNAGARQVIAYNTTESFHQSTPGSYYGSLTIPAGSLTEDKFLTVQISATLGHLAADPTYVYLGSFCTGSAFGSALTANYDHVFYSSLANYNTAATLSYSHIIPTTAAMVGSGLTVVYAMRGPNNTASSMRLKPYAWYVTG